MLIVVNLLVGVGFMLRSECETTGYGTKKHFTTTENAQRMRLSTSK